MRISHLLLFCGLAVSKRNRLGTDHPGLRSSHLHSENGQNNFLSHEPNYVFDQTYTEWTSEQNTDNIFYLVRENVTLSSSQISVNSYCYGSADSNPRQRWSWNQWARYSGDFTFGVQIATAYNLDIVTQRILGSGLVTLYNDLTNTSIFSTGTVRQGITHYATSGVFGPGQYRLHVEGYGPAAGALGDGTFESTTNLTFVPAPGVGAILTAAGVLGLRRRR